MAIYPCTWYVHTFRGSLIRVVIRCQYSAHAGNLAISETFQPNKALKQGRSVAAPLSLALDFKGQSFRARIFSNAL